MKDHVATLAAVLACSCFSIQAQRATYGPLTSSSKLTQQPYDVDLAFLDVTLLLPDPPADGSIESNAELAALHQIQDVRTSPLTAAATSDEEQEDIFIFKSVIGQEFTPEAFPMTARLSIRVKSEQGIIGSRLKRRFHRERPYQIDSTLHPVCKVNSVHDSYPSGHAFAGYLQALTLVQLFPGKRDAIFARADEYAHNRMVCGVHYPSDLEAGRRVAYAVFGLMLAIPTFRDDLQNSRVELSKRFVLGSK